jgi:hypothetical protein
MASRNGRKPHRAWNIMAPHASLPCQIHKVNVNVQYIYIEKEKKIREVFII